MSTPRIGDGDEEANHWIGPGQAERDAACSEEDGEAGEAVGAGVQPVGDEGGRADRRPTRMR